MAYNKLLGVDTHGVQVGLQHLSFQIYWLANYVLETITNVAAIVYRVLDQWRQFYKLYPIFMHPLLINACSAANATSVLGFYENLYV